MSVQSVGVLAFYLTASYGMRALLLHLVHVGMQRRVRSLDRLLSAVQDVAASKVGSTRRRFSANLHLDCLLQGRIRDRPVAEIR